MEKYKDGPIFRKIKVLKHLNNPCTEGYPFTSHKKCSKHETKNILPLSPIQNNSINLKSKNSVSILLTL